MKATIEFDDELYRQLKTVAALRGAKIKELVAECPIGSQGRGYPNENAQDQAACSKIAKTRYIAAHKQDDRRV